MTTDTTAERIVLAAIKILLKQGMKRSSLADVAHEAGVTRVTIYRYYDDKQGLIDAVCRRLADIFRRAAQGNPDDSIVDIDVRLQRLAEELSGLPPGNLLALFDEIRRVYPRSYEEFRTARDSALDQLFEQAIVVASRERVVREGVNLQVVKGMFRALMMGFFDSPALIAANVPYAEICETVTKVLRHGVLKGDDDRQAADHPAS
jgi:AcrR family transcriptional regulator